MIKKKLNRKQRAAIRRAKIAAGTYVAPAKPVKKKKVSLQDKTDCKLKKKARMLPGIIPQFRPRFVRNPHPFLGGGIVARLVIPDGWQLVTADAPNLAEYRIAELRSLPTPDGTAKIARFVLRNATKADLAQRAVAVIEEEKRAEAKRLKRSLDRERTLLEIKTVISRVRGTRERRKK